MNVQQISQILKNEIFGIHEFFKLALEGQTIALDMLHAPAANIIQTSDVWERIVAKRHKFYSKNIHSFLGYAIGQAAKYGVKGSRLSDAQAVLGWLETLPPGSRLGDNHFADLPHGDQIKVGYGDFIDVCGKKLQYTCKVSYLADILKKFVDNYGERARLAANNQGIDWKAVSHALRAAYQMKELFSLETITFPRPEAAYLTAVKICSV